MGAKKISAIALGALVTAAIVGVSVLTGGAAPQDRPLLVAIGTASTGSGGYNYGIGLSRTVNNNQDDIRTSVQATAGFAENLVLLHEGEILLGLSQDDLLRDAYSGSGQFERTGAMSDLRWIAAVALPVWHCFARADSGIRRLSDIRGRKFNIGPRQTSTRAINELVLQAAAIEITDFQAFELPTSTVFDAIQNRVVSGSCNAFPVGHGSLTSLTNFTDIVFLELEPSVVDRMAGLSAAPMVQAHIPAGSYAGLNRDVPSFAGVVVLATNAQASNDVIYDITAAFWDNLTQLQVQPQFRTLSLTSNTAYGFGNVPVHPGAAQYYLERGIIEPVFH